MKTSFAVSILLVSSACAFVPSRPSTTAQPADQSSTSLSFGLPNFAPKNDDDEPEAEEKKIGLSGLTQLITAGLGSPFLGEFEGVEEETGTMMFSLEANNLVDENGESKQTKMPYFESGWVDESEQNKEGFKFPWQK